MTVIAVTGASGFIGSEFIRSTTALGWQAIPILRNDLSEDRLLARLSGCDAVVHLAGRAHIVVVKSSQDEQEFRPANVQLTQSVADAACRAGVRRFVFVSSAGVLGRASPPAGFSDASVSAPHDAYTQSKLAAEDMLFREFDGGMEIVVVRSPLVYGPDAPGNFGRLVGLVRLGIPLPLGALRAPRSMVGLRNLCDLLCRTSVHPAAPGMRMLVADAETRCVADLVSDIAMELGRRARVLAVPGSVLRAGLWLAGRSADFDRLAAPFVVHAEQARHRLGWSPPYRFEDELAWSLAEPSASSRTR